MSIRSLMGEHPEWMSEWFCWCVLGGFWMNDWCPRKGGLGTPEPPKMHPQHNHFPLCSNFRGERRQTLHIFLSFKLGQEKTWDIRASKHASQSFSIFLLFSTFLERGQYLHWLLSFKPTVTYNILQYSVFYIVKDDISQIFARKQPNNNL